MTEKIGNINFQTFTKTIDCIRDISDWQNRLTSLGIDLTGCFELEYIESQLIDLLNKGMGLAPEYCDEISYYCYERDFGRDNSLGDCKIKEKSYPLNNNRDLWIWIADLIKA